MSALSYIADANLQQTRTESMVLSNMLLTLQDMGQHLNIANEALHHLLVQHVRRGSGTLEDEQQVSQFETFHHSAGAEELPLQDGGNH